MARNIRWYVQFKSLNGTQCRINIYDNDWPEGVTMGLRGAADPFYYEENNSNDLLNDVMRYRTGYIRLVEDYFGALNDIYPTSTFDRYVEFLYNGVVMFNGYIQVQDFSNTLEFSSQADPCPREVEFPVISPMGLFDKRTFTPISPPTTKTLGQLLDMMLSSSTYTKVVCPDIYTAGLWMTVYSLVVCPWNKDYNHSMVYDAYHKVIKSESYAYLIEGICKAFGWICHDTPQALVFTMFDHEGYYCYYDVGHIGDANYKHAESVGSTAVALTGYYTLADTNARIDTLLPDTGIEVSYEGDLGKVDFGFERTTYNGISTDPTSIGYGDLDQVSSVCNLWPIDQLWEMYSISSEVIFNNDGTIPPGNHCVAWKDYVGILASMSGSQNDGETLFTIRFYTPQRLGSGWSVSFETMYSRYGNIQGLKADDEIGNLYVNTQKTVYSDYVEVVFKYHFDNSQGSIVPQLPLYALIFVHNIKFQFQKDNEPFSEYKLAPATSSDYIPSLEAKVSSSITMPISLYRLNDHMIGNTLYTTRLTEYDYLFRKRLELNGKFRLAAQAPSLFHAMMWSYVSHKWRIIASSFHPWDDEYELTLQHSPLFELVKYSVTTFADHTNLSGYTAQIIAGESFNVVLTVNGGFNLLDVEVKMGGVNITSTAYNSGTGEIYIAAVSGNVVITTVTEEKVYDAQVEWLQSDGTAYIDTGVNVANTTRFQIFANVPHVTEGPWLFGGRGHNSNNQQLGVSRSYSSGVYLWRFNTGNNTGPSISTSAEDIVFDNYSTSAARYCLIKGTNVTGSDSTFSTNITFVLFGYNNAGTVVGSMDGLRFYSAKIYSYGTLIRDFIPVRKNGVGYFYDKVSGALFGNANSSGSFTYGNDINS